MTTCPYKGIQMRWTTYFGIGLDEIQKFEVSGVGFQRTITTTHCHFANFLPLAKGLLWTCSFYLHELFEAETWWFWSQWDYYTCQNNQKYEAVWYKSTCIIKSWIVELFLKMIIIIVKLATTPEAERNPFNTTAVFIISRKEPIC